MSQVFVIDRENDYKVRFSYMDAANAKGNPQWGALGDCFSIVTVEDFTAHALTGPQMLQIMAHYTKVPAALRKRKRSDIAKKVFLVLNEADIKLDTLPEDAPRLRDQSDRVIMMIRKVFNGHKNSTRSKCFALIEDGMTVEAYLAKATVELRLTRPQALGCLQKLASHSTTPSVRLVK